MKTPIKIIIIILTLIISINIIGLIISEFTSSSYILKINKNAYIFAHGQYTNNNNKTYHYTTIDKQPILTENLLNKLREEGYTKIWISMCEQGNSDYIYEDNETKIKWGNDVDRIKQPGIIYPIFYGFGLYRIVI